MLEWVGDAAAPFVALYAGSREGLGLSGPQTTALWGVGWAVFFFLVRSVVAPIFFRCLRGDEYTRLPIVKRVENEARVLAFVHAIIVAPLAVYTAFYDPVMSTADLYTGNSDIARFTVAVSLGFFLFDFVDCSRYFEAFGVPFTVHAVLCLLAYSYWGVFRCVFCWFGVFGLVFEVSTIPLNIRIIFGLVGCPRWVIQFWNVMFASSFFLARIVGGAYVEYVFWTFATQHWHALPKADVVVLFFLSTPLIILNAIWFTKAPDIILGEGKGWIEGDKYWVDPKAKKAA